MPDLKAFHNQLINLLRSVPPLDDGRRPTQRELAQAIGLAPAELSRRLNGAGRSRLTNDNARAIVRTLAKWEVIQTQAAALDLLAMLACPAFTLSEWQQPPLDRLAPLAASQRGMDSPSHNLPFALSSFVGREAALAGALAILADLAAEHRLLTVTGAGGIGKTRFAIETARGLLAAYPDGVWLVRLASLRDHRLLLGLVGTTVGCREEPGRTLIDTLSDYLRHRRILLLLDNCEHLLAACANLGELLLSRCPTLAILATSREPLGIAGEVDWHLPSLSLPPTSRDPDPQQLAQSEAVQLFIARAIAVKPGFRVSEGNAPVLAQLCRRLDGTPLAIELAAPLVRALTVEKILSRLDDRFSLLRSSDPTLMPHQRTLRASLEWSYELLTEAERSLFRRLAVFAGSFTLEAIEVVTADAAISSYQVTALLVHLVEKSLVATIEQGEEIRYYLLETMREYAASLLVGEELITTQRRFCQLYLELVEAAKQGITGEAQGGWLKRLDAEYPNIRAALETALRSDWLEVAMRMVVALLWYWEVRGYLGEGWQWLTQLLARLDATPPSLRAAVLDVAGVLASRLGKTAEAIHLLGEAVQHWEQLPAEARLAATLGHLGMAFYYQSDYPSARVSLLRSLDIRRRLGDQAGVASALINLGNILSDEGDYGAARSCYQESLTLFRELGDRASTANALNNLAATANDEGDYPTAAALFAESLAIRRELGDQPGIVSSLYGLALVAYHEGRYREARPQFEECLALARAISSVFYIGYSLHSLGQIARHQGEYAAARRLLDEGISVLVAANRKFDIIQVLESWAALLLAESEADRAVQLYAAGSALRVVIGSSQRSHDEQAEYERSLASLRAQLSEANFSTNWQAGQALNLEQAVVYARATTKSPSPTSKTPSLNK